MANFMNFGLLGDRDEQMMNFALGLLANSGPSTDPRSASLAAGIGAGGQAAMQTMAKQRQEKREDRRLGMEEDAILAKQHEALRKQGMAAQMGTWWKEGSPKGPQTPELMTQSYRALGDKLMTSGNVEGAKQAYDLAKQYQEKYQAPITAMQGGKPVLVQPGDQGGVRALSGYDPATKLEQVNVKNKILGVDPYTYQPKAEFGVGMDPNVLAEGQYLFGPNGEYLFGNKAGVIRPAQVAKGVPTYPFEGAQTQPKGGVAVSPTGAPMTKVEPPAEGITKMALFEGGMDKATTTLKGLERTSPDAIMPSVPESVAGSLPLVGNAAKNTVVSPERQKYIQAQNQWKLGIKRLESGAAVTVPEDFDYEKTFFPVLGDSEETRIGKSKAREEYAEGLRRVITARTRGSLVGGTTASPVVPGAPEPYRKRY